MYKMLGKKPDINYVARVAEFLAASCHFLSLRFRCYPQDSHFIHHQSMSQARKTAIIELEMVGAIIRFINPVEQASGISASMLF